MLLTVVLISYEQHMLPAVVLYRIGLVLMRTQEGNSLGVSNFLLTVVAWLLTVIFRPSACIPCLQASTHIAREYSLLPPHPYFFTGAVLLRYVILFTVCHTLGVP